MREPSGPNPPRLLLSRPLTGLNKVCTTSERSTREMVTIVPLIYESTERFNDYASLVDITRCPSAVVKQRTEQSGKIVVLWLVVERGISLRSLYWKYELSSLQGLFASGGDQLKEYSSFSWLLQDALKKCSWHTSDQAIVTDFQVQVQQVRHQISSSAIKQKGNLAEINDF